MLKSKREFVARELEELSEQGFDKLLVFLHSLKNARAEAALPMLAAESSLAKDWLTPEEDFTWADL